MSVSEVFSQPWSEALGEALNASESYRVAAAGWEGSIVFALRPANGAVRRGTYLDLLHGSCRAARAATPEDLSDSDFLLSADAATWRGLLNGQGDALFAVMTGRLALERGSLARLLPFPGAAKELVTTAARLGGSVPEE